MRYAFVKRFEPAYNRFTDTPESLTNSFNHPDRYRISLVMTQVEDGVVYCQEPGRQGSFPFPDNFCPMYLGEYPAVILRYLTPEEEQEKHLFQEDQFIPFTK